MSNAKAALKQNDLKRYATALRQAGIDEWRVEIESPDGTKVSIVAGRASAAEGAADDFDAMIGRLP